MAPFQLGTWASRQAKPRPMGLEASEVPGPHEAPSERPHIWLAVAEGAFLGRQAAHQAFGERGNDFVLQNRRTVCIIADCVGERTDEKISR
jgi:hypothetical protein